MTTWNFHDLTVFGETNDALLRDRWQQSFASRPVVSDSDPDISLKLNLVDAVPSAPDRDPDFKQGDLLAYYVDGDRVIVHFPRFGRLTLDLNAATTQGEIVADAINTYGVIEDLLAISLSPHLRRKGYFLLHAFAAAWKNEAVLVVGGIGAGKTTTGMSLLNAGWQLLSNDSPIVAAGGMCLGYPGVLAGYPETFARFETCAHLADQKIETSEGRKKLMVSAESIWPNVWLDRAPVKAIIFPQIEDRAEHWVEPLSLPDTLRRLLPHAVEQWDRAMIPSHLATLRALVDAAPGYALHLSPDVLAIPDVLADLMQSP